MSPSNSKSIEGLKQKKRETVNEIIRLRMKKAEIDKSLDAIYNKDYDACNESPLKLVNELYSINTNINHLRSKVDAINKKLQIRQTTITTWL